MSVQIARETVVSASPSSLTDTTLDATTGEMLLVRLAELDEQDPKHEDVRQEAICAAPRNVAISRILNSAYRRCSSCGQRSRDCHARP